MYETSDTQILLSSLLKLMIWESFLDIFLQNCSKPFLRDATDGKTQFRQGMARKTEASTDFGPAARHASTLIHIDLEMVSQIFQGIL